MRLSTAVLIVSLIASLDLTSAKKEVKASASNEQMSDMEDVDRAELARANATVTTSMPGESSENMTTNSTSSTNQTTSATTSTTVPTSMVTNSTEKANVTETTTMAPMTTLTPEVTTPKGNSSAVVVTSLSAVSLCVISLLVVS